MTPANELRSLIRRLEGEIHIIANTSANALRISDRRRELVRCTDLLHKLENRTSQASKVRCVPSPDDDPADCEVLDQIFRRTVGRD